MDNIFKIIQKDTMLKIGQIKILEKNGESVWTILGSCISVIFYVRDSFSLICHAQMPSSGSSGQVCSEIPFHPGCFLSPDSDDFKYVKCSLNYMIQILAQEKVNFQNIHTSLLGGASVFDIFGHKETIGEQNIKLAKNILGKHGIRINRELTGGSEGLTIWYNPKNNSLIYRKHKSEERYELPG